MKQILTSIFLTFNFFLFSQEFPNLLSPNKVTTISYWTLNESVHYEVKRSSNSYKGDSKKPRKSEETTYSFDIKVIDSTEESYVLEMKYGKYNFGKDSDPILNELSSLQNGMKIIYRTNELGVFDTILNLPELRDNLMIEFEDVKKLVGEKIKDPEDKKLYEEAIEITVSNLQDVENIEALFLADIIPLHGYAGIEMVLSKMQDVELDYPCIGDYVLTGTGKLTLNSIVKNADECNFISNEKPDQAELKTYVKMLSRIFFIDEKRKPLESEVTMTMSTKNKMKMELSTGWMKKITTISTITVKDHKHSWKKTQVAEYVKK